MKITAAFVLGVLTGLAFVRIPHYVGPLFQDEPQTPEGHQTKSRYWNGGVVIDRVWPEFVSTASLDLENAPRRRGLA